MRAITIILPTLFAAAVAPVHAQNCLPVPGHATDFRRLSQAALDSILVQEEVRRVLENDLREAARAAGIAHRGGS